MFTCITSAVSFFAYASVFVCLFVNCLVAIKHLECNIPFLQIEYSGKCGLDKTSERNEGESNKVRSSASQISKSRRGKVSMLIILIDLSLTRQGPLHAYV